MVPKAWGEESQSLLEEKSCPCVKNVSHVLKIEDTFELNNNKGAAALVSKGLNAD